MGELLDAVGDAALEVSAVPPGRLGLEELAPLRLEVRRRRGLEDRDPSDEFGHETFSVCTVS